VCGNGAGIAEYSNARFLSDDRLFDAYAHPAMADTQLESVTLPNGKVRRYYRFAAGHGENDYYLGVRSVLAGWLPSGIIHEVVLDDRVLADYGRKLFPKAVGYSAALLDYFFRGTGGADGAPVLRVAAVDLGTGHGTLRVTNESAEDMQGGTLHVFYDHRTTGVRTWAGSTAVTIPAGQHVDIADGGGIDLLGVMRHGPIDGEIAIVYRGPMGSEPDAVAARVCSCPLVEPVADPIAADCLGVCPCTWRSFTTGSPGTPGDDVVVPPAQIQFDGLVRFVFPTCFDSTVFQDDFTVTVFPATPLRAASLAVQAATPPTPCFAGNCGTVTGGAWGPANASIGQTTVNGVVGSYGTVPRSNGVSVSCSGQSYPLLASGVWGCFTTQSGCGSNCPCTTVDLDAAMVCYGPGAFPAD
jgi:hypothetical protein